MQPEVIASEPLYPKANSYDLACRKLALGILLQAFRDILSPRRSTWKKGEDWNSDALDWFDGEEDYPGSFRWVCDHLRISPVTLRDWLRRYKQSPLQERRKLAENLVRFQISRTA